MPNSILPSHEYYLECDAVAQAIAERAYELVLDDHEREDIDEDVLRDVISYHGLDYEEIDGHEYAIYYKYHLPILQISGNDEAYVGEFGEDSVGNILKEKGITGLHAALSGWAFYQDVMEYLEDALEKRIGIESEEG